MSQILQNIKLYL